MGEIPSILKKSNFLRFICYLHLTLTLLTTNEMAGHHFKNYQKFILVERLIVNLISSITIRIMMGKWRNQSHSGMTQMLLYYKCLSLYPTLVKYNIKLIQLVRMIQNYNGF